MPQMEFADYVPQVIWLIICFGCLYFLMSRFALPRGGLKLQKIKNIEEGVRLRVQHEDDLWTRAQIVRPGCQVGMMGFRRDQSTGTQESGRAKAADRNAVWIVLDAESTEFQQLTDNLRIHGIISQADFDKGSHHTHAVGPRDELEISWRGGISESDRSLLAEAI